MEENKKAARKTETAIEALERELKENLERIEELQVQNKQLFDQIQDNVKEGQALAARNGELGPRIDYLKNAQL